jgi:aryl-alcohol dehydrogenase-like predicted oxidoreductase
MAHSHLNFNGNKINRIGFGCWQLAGAYDLNGRPNGYGTIDTPESVRALHAALDNGINFFDTAIGYGAGRSEIVLGEALKSYRGPASVTPIICTKYGMIEGADNDEDDFGPVNLIRSVENSLQRLQIDCLGAMLLHNPPDDFDFSAFDTAPFEQLKKEGKILAYGVSCRTQKGVANVLKSGFGSVVEAVYNPLDRRYENFFSDPLYKDKYTFICRVPLASGFISPRTLEQNPEFPANDIRSNFNEEQVGWVSGAVRALAFLQDLQGGISVSALRFQLSNPFNNLVIPGIKNTRQLQDAVWAMQLGPLPMEVLEQIAIAVPEVYYKWR